MKAVFALALVGAVAAVPAGWQDVPSEGTTTPAVPVKETTTTPAVETKTWEDVVSSTTTTKPVEVTSTGTWADVSISTTTTPVADTSSTVWGDYSAPATETTSTLTAITTHCAKPTSFQDKGETYSCSEGENLTLTKGPYTVTIPIYEETSSVCETPVAPTGAASTWADVPAPAGPTGSAPVSPASPSAGVPGKPAGEEPVSPYTGSASKMAGAGLAGVAAIAALLL